MRRKQDNNLTEYTEYSAEQNQIALAELLDERGKADDSDDLRNILKTLHNAHDFDVVQHILCVVSSNGAVYVLVQSNGHHGERENDEVLVLQGSLQTLCERHSLGFLGCIGWETFLTALVAEQQHEESNDRVNRANGDPCLLAAAEHVDERQGKCGNDQVADRGHGHAEQIELCKVIVIAGHHRRQVGIRQVECGIYAGGAQVIGDEYINCLHHRARMRRHAEHQHGGNTVWCCHPEYPRLPFGEFTLSTIWAISRSLMPSNTRDTNRIVPTSAADMPITFV